VQAARFISASAGYYVAYIAGALSALVSMPITTRLLSPEEYGLLSLASAMVSLLTGVALFGVSQGKLRLVEEFLWW
jgi:O-antigen/teichoic acid export membrane protein